MVTMDQCTVRYLLCGMNSTHEEFINKLIYDFKQFIHCDYNKGWLPEMMISNDGEFIWAYFTYPLSDVDKRFIRAFTAFDLFIEERLI